MFIWPRAAPRRPFVPRTVPKPSASLESELHPLLHTIGRKKDRIFAAELVRRSLAYEPYNVAILGAMSVAFPKLRKRWSDDALREDGKKRALEEPVASVVRSILDGAPSGSEKSPRERERALSRVERAMANPNLLPACDDCGAKRCWRRVGDNRPFVGCSQFPKCRARAISIEQLDHMLANRFVAKSLAADRARIARKRSAT